MIELPRLWSGSQDTLEYLAAAADSAQAYLEARAGSVDPFELPPLLVVQEGVGMVSVKGPLINGNAGYMRLWGVTGYADIQEAVMQAAETKTVKSILMLYATGGGAVEGVDETSNFIKQISALKPVVTYATGSMASAGYWLGSAAARRMASATSIVGSIGVTVTHFDRSEQLKKDGIDAKVYRSGKWKALGNPYEPRSDLFDEQMQSMVKDLNDIFEARIAANLGVTTRQVHDRMGQGREFLGARAVEVGLVDGVATLQEAFTVAKMLGRS